MKNLKVKGHNNLERTPSNAVINNNTDEYNKYLKNKKKMEAQNKEFEMMKNEIELLKNQVRELMKK